MPRRPWDFKQHFAVDEDGEVTQGGYFGERANAEDFRHANAVEREEVRKLSAGARERHCEDVTLQDVPWQGKSCE